jgi:RNA polymerase sigma-70 factor, ECF subfamily
MREIKYKDDYNLVDRYLSGDKSAGEELFGSVYPILKGYVFNQTENSSLNEKDKDEIVLDTLMIAVEKLNTYIGESKFSTLVIGIAKMKILEKFRKKKMDLSRTVDIASLSNMPTMSRNPLEILIEKEKRQAVQRAISMLSPEHKQILTLRLFNNMPYKQLATISGKSEAALDSMYRRAIKSFIKNFKEIYF